MAKFELLNNSDHQNLRIKTERSITLGDQQMTAMVFPFEFRSAQGCFPILFSPSGTDETMVPVALMGLERGENLFFADDKWEASYTPALLRCQPFLIAQQQTQIDGIPSLQKVVSIDTQSPRISTEEGEPIFLPQGGYSDYLTQQMELLEQVYAGRTQNQQFAAELNALDLLEDITLKIKMNDGSNHQLVGFKTLNEDKLDNLSGEQLEALNRKGFLFAIYLILASHVHLKSLIERKHRT